MTNRVHGSRPDVDPADHVESGYLLGVVAGVPAALAAAVLAYVACFGSVLLAFPWVTMVVESGALIGCVRTVIQSRQRSRAYRVLVAFTVLGSVIGTASALWILVLVISDPGADM
jgi:Na+/phosphate symporter